MRLAAFQKSHSQDRIFQLTETLATSLLSVITVATNRDELIWKYHGAHSFSAKFNDLGLLFDNDEPPSLHFLDGNVIRDNGSGSYGFDKLNSAILEQQKRRAKPQNLEQIAHSRSREVFFCGSHCRE